MGLNHKTQLQFECKTGIALLPYLCPAQSLFFFADILLQNKKKDYNVSFTCSQLPERLLIGWKLRYLLGGGAALLSGGQCPEQEPGIDAA